MHGVYENGLGVTVRLRIIWLLNIVPASAGRGLLEVVHVQCVQVLVCVIEFLVYSIMWSAFHHVYTVVT